MPQYRTAVGDRSLVADLEYPYYLAYAAISPATRAVRDALHESIEDYARVGQLAIGRTIEQRERLRGKVARLLNARAEEIGLTTGTTHGLLQLAFCIDWKPGDRVVVFRGEFPANFTPWQNAAACFDLELCELQALGASVGGRDRSQDADLSELETTLRGGGVRLVAISAVAFQTGYRAPLRAVAELCHAHGAELCVDLIQACGVVPVDVRASGIDYAAGGAHKWLMGAQGAGFLYARGELQRLLIPRMAGWLSHEDGVRFLFEPGQLRYDRPLKRSIDFVEGGSQSALSSVAMEAGLDPILELGVPAIFSHVSAYLDRLESPLMDRGFESLRSTSVGARSGMLCLVPPEGKTAAELVSSLRAHGVVASMPDGNLRFAPQFTNSVEEVPSVLEAVDAALAR
ncbi:MAG TPA: aminotransferase class V-fold PLP-dependent enzyme [Polyangiaceae bacterium]|nr:aminotransferase class V-fold PLP-dependent enzyme [Polyangiaceae bacterium]